VTPRPCDFLYVFDTSPLSAFARTGRLDVIERRYGGRAVVTVEVREGLERGVGLHPQLSRILVAPWLRPPVELTEPEQLREIEFVRWALGAAGDDRLANRGEAATIVYAKSVRAIAVLDDRDARTIANSNDVAIVGTEGILRTCAHDGELPWGEAWDVFLRMRRLGFRLRDITFDEFTA
jgi:predicted nucleic acid-binding protein